MANADNIKMDGLNEVMKLLAEEITHTYLKNNKRLTGDSLDGEAIKILVSKCVESVNIITEAIQALKDEINRLREDVDRIQVHQPKKLR